MTIFFRLLDADDKGTALQEAIAALPQNPTPEAFTVNPESCEQVPRSPFAYWASEKIRHYFVQYANQLTRHEARCGMGTLDNFRFLK